MSVTHVPIAEIRDKYYWITNLVTGLESPCLDVGTRFCATMQDAPFNRTGFWLCLD